MFGLDRLTRTFALDRLPSLPLGLGELGQGNAEVGLIRIDSRKAALASSGFPSSRRASSRMNCETASVGLSFATLAHY